MSSKQTILVVDDDAHIREVIRFALEKAGFRVVEAADGHAALERFEEASPALLVLDILMPELDGTEVCRRLRAQSRVPIVFLSSMDEEVDRIVGLELGGDDYVTKPFSPRELVARVRAVLRRTAPAEAGESAPEREARSVTHGKLKLDLDRYQAYWGEQELVLTVTEFGLLKTLLGYPGKVYTRDELMDGAYREDNIVTDRTIDSHVRRVRRKFAELGADPIETVHGVGYKIADCM
jgi:two-component system OmpR family response regulator